MGREATARAENKNSLPAAARRISQNSYNAEPMKIERYFDKTKKKNRWRVDFTLDAQRIREKGFASRDEAEEFIFRMKQRSRARKHKLPLASDPISLQELREARANDPNSFKPKLTLRMLDKLIQLCPSGITLQQLKRGHIRALTDWLRTQNLKPSSINLYLACVSGALHDACEYFPVLDDWQPPKISRVKGAEHRERVVTSTELTQLFTILNAEPGLTEVADTLRLMLLTGARRKEIRTLSAESINYDWRTVQLRKTKNGTNRVVPLSQTSIDILSKYSKPMLAKVSESQFYDLMAEFSEAGKLSYGNNIDGGFVPHDFRHTVATHLESSGTPYSHVAALLGHKRKDQTATYTHANLENLRAAVERLENWCREIDEFIPGQVRSNSAKLVNVKTFKEK